MKSIDVWRLQDLVSITPQAVRTMSICQENDNIPSAHISISSCGPQRVRFGHSPNPQHLVPTALELIVHGSHLVLTADFSNMLTDPFQVW